jgi:hypothetical protein
MGEILNAFVFRPYHGPSKVLEELAALRECDEAFLGFGEKRPLLNGISFKAHVYACSRRSLSGGVAYAYQARLKIF